MRILVTGGAGYIGSHTVKRLFECGHECVVLDTLERGWREAVDARADFVIGSVGDPAAVRSALRGCDGVVHLAGYTQVAESLMKPEMYFENNAVAPVTLLDAMCEMGVLNLVFSSTAAVYGDPARVPIVESDLTEPVNPYGASKLAFEGNVHAYKERGLRAVIFRYFNVAGAWPGGEIGECHEPETHLIPAILRSVQAGMREFEVFGSDFPTPDGTCIRDYVHVCDLGDAHAIGIERLGAGFEGGVFNLGNGSGFSNLEVVRACGEVTGSTITVRMGPRREGDPAVLVASAARATVELGWRPKRSALEQMISDAWTWHLARPDGYR